MHFQISRFKTVLLLVLCVFLENINVQGRKGTPIYTIKKVVLDAGHGGKDSGCIGKHSHEKHNALAVVLKLGAMIEAHHPEVEVIYTRKTDVFVPLHERANIANRAEADLFISVHCNAMSASSASGTETYVLGQHVAGSNLEVVKRENSAIYLEQDYQKNYEGYDPNSPEAHIMGNMLQNAFLEQSVLYAGLVQVQAATYTGLKNRGVKQAGFLVLRATAMPAVLVETGYLTNASDEAFLRSPEGQERMARALFEAFVTYKATYEGTLPAGYAAAKSNSTPPKQNKPQSSAVKTSSKNEGSTLASTNKNTQSPFTILLLEVSEPIDRNQAPFSSLTDLKESKTQGGYMYLTGSYSDQATAESVLSTLKSGGFPEAKIIKTYQ